MKQKFLLKTMLLLCALIAGSGTMWADDSVVLYLETFGSTTSNTAFSSYTDFSAETSMFSTSGTVQSHYSGSGSVGKNNLSAVNLSSGYTGASGLSGCYHTVTANTAATIIQISNINIEGYTDLALSFGALGGSASHEVNVSYKIDDGAETSLISNGSINNSSWTLLSENISGTGSSLTLYFKHTPTKAWTIRLDDIKLTGTVAVTNYAITKSATNGTISTKVSNSEVTSAAENATVTIEATPNTGYSFSSWSVTKTSGGAAVSVANASANPTTFTMPAEAVTVAATFTINTHDLDLTTDHGTCAVTVDGDDWDGSSAIAYGAAVEITATPSSGYLFDEWDHTLTSPTISSNVISFSMPDEDVAIEAKYVDASSVKAITISDAIEHGTVTASANTAAAGTEITLTATPDTGYSFTSWSVKNASTDADITVTDNKFTMPDANVTVSATFTAIAVTGVSLNKTSASISVGETETLTATVAPANALNKAVTWTSSNTSVATVSNGVVTAVAAGSATITVTTTDGSFTATCAVTVVNAVTFNAASDKGSTTGNNSADEMTKSDVTISSTDAAFKQTEYRLYSGSTTTISTSSGKITRIEFTVNGSYSLSNLSTATGTYNSSTGVWTGTATSVAFYASAQVRLDQIVVYYATTATPSFSVAGGEYSEAKSVTISCATDGASIYYTTDGTTPSSSSTTYSSAISIVETTTLKAIAIKDGVESEVASATYTMNRPAAPTFDVAACVFDAAFDVHLGTETDGATIYYTLDGTTPTTASSEYDTKVTIPTATTTLKAIAVKSGLTSDVSSVTYTYDARTTPTFSLSSTAVDLKVNVAGSVTLTTDYDEDITVTSSDPTHMPVSYNSSTKVCTFTPTQAGDYTITFSATGSENYKDAEAVVNVTVTKKATTMVLTLSFTSKDLYVTTTGSLTGIPQYNNSNIDGATVTYSSSDETVATIALNGAVTFKKAGSTTLAASYAGSDEYEECEATYVLELIDTTPQETNVTVELNSTTLGSTAPNGKTATNNNVSVTTNKGSATNDLVANSAHVRMYKYSNLVVSAPAGYMITNIVFNEPASDKTWNDSPTASSGTYSSKTWTGKANSVTFTFNAGQCRIASIDVTLAPAVTITASKYATYCSPYKLDFSESDVKAYKASVNKTTGKVTLTQIDVVPAEEGVILYCETPETYAIPVTTKGASDVTGNEMVGVTEETDVYWNPSTGVYNYILQQGTFKKALEEGGKLRANRAYLSTSYDVTTSGARELQIVFDDDETTGVQSIDNDNRTIDNAIYNLKGQRVAQPVKGQLYIINGKKTLMK